MALNPLKRIVKSTLNRDPIEQVFWGTPTADTYSKVLHNYRSMTSEYRQQTVSRCLKKLSKVKESDMTIANLVLVHKLSKIDFIQLPSEQPQIQENGKKKQIAMAEKNFIKFYFSFLKQTQIQNSNQMSSLQDKIGICEIGLNKCLHIIRNNIVIDYCLMHSTNQLTLRIALRQIFEDIRKDLQTTTKLVESSAKMIYQEKSQTSYALNEVYETLIFVNKSIHKISVLIKKAGLAINLPLYQMNRDLNMKIEMEMNMRKDERIKFKTEKHIKSKKNIQIQESPQNNHTNHRGFQSLSQIDQDQILIQHDELF